MKRCRLLLADDHDIVIEGLRRVLDHPDIEIVGVVKDGRALLRAAKELRNPTSSSPTSRCLCSTVLRPLDKSARATRT